MGIGKSGLLNALPHLVRWVNWPYRFNYGRLEDAVSLCPSRKCGTNSVIAVYFCARLELFDSGACSEIAACCVKKKKMECGRLINS